MLVMLICFLSMFRSFGFCGRLSICSIDGWVMLVLISMMVLLSLVVMLSVRLMDVKFLFLLVRVFVIISRLVWLMVVVFLFMVFLISGCLMIWYWLLVWECGVWGIRKFWVVKVIMLSLMCLEVWLLFFCIEMLMVWGVWGVGLGDVVMVGGGVSDGLVVCVVCCLFLGSIMLVWCSCLSCWVVCLIKFVMLNYLLVELYG